MAKLKHNDIELFYEIRGDGPPLLLIPGLASDSQSWMGVIGELAAHFRVIAVDNRGSGRTTPMNVPLSISSMADDCIALIKALGFPSVSMVGHSMGGFIAQECAIRYPTSVDRLVLMATSSSASKRNVMLFSDLATRFEQAYADSPSSGNMEGKRKAELSLWFREIFYWIFSERFFGDEKLFQAAVQYSLEYPFPQSPVAFRNQVNALAAFHREADISRIVAKTLVIGGGRDLLFSSDACADFAKRVPGAVFTLIPEAGHSVHMDNPVEFLAAVKGFLRSM
ncbi:MAG: alpha/beta hydrolase [Candidatus Ozemobacteraceae bacterium]